MSRRTTLAIAVLTGVGLTIGDVAGLLGETSANAAGPWGGYSNGRIPTSALTPVPASVGPYLKPDAAAKYFQFNDAFRAQFGKALSITEGYRDYARQEYLYDQYLHHGGSLASPAGGSNHGWAQACDFGSQVNIYGTPEKAWADANGPTFGWFPTGNGFSRPEPWHFDFTPNPNQPPTQGDEFDMATLNDLRTIVHEEMNARGIQRELIQTPDGTVWVCFDRMFRIAIPSSANLSTITANWTARGIPTNITPRSLSDANAWGFPLYLDAANRLARKSDIPVT